MADWIHHRDWVRWATSTQDLGRQWVEGGGDLPALFVADYQQEGRGRWGRAWVAPPSEALLFTLVSEWPQSPAWWLLGSAIVWAEILQHFTGLPVRLKWPNDLRLYDRKLGGGLLEEVEGGEGRRYALLGWGVNVNLTSGHLPPELQGSSVSLQQATGRQWDRLVLLDAFLGRLSEVEGRVRRGEQAALRAAWLRYSDTIGRRVRVDAGGRSWEGVAVGLSLQGELRLQTSEGELEVAVGDVEHLVEPEGKGRA